VKLEDYDDAATLKVAIAAVAKDDTVGTVISNLNVSIFSPIVFLFSAFSLHSIGLSLFCFRIFQRAVEEERYSDAAFLRDEAGTGLVSSHCKNIFVFFFMERNLTCNAKG